jgi:outer membrane protein OmpA-like peptidoglycan-associated protein
MQHCLGGQACNAVKNGLIAAGMTAGRINTISHGKESPFCTEHNEA